MTGRIADRWTPRLGMAVTPGRLPRPLRVYVASSIRNERFHDVVDRIRSEGHAVYDFQDEPTFFSWAEIAEGNSLEAGSRRAILDEAAAKRAFLGDMIALLEADACVLVLPAGASSHLELGYAVGAGKRAIVLLDGGPPELMYAMATTLCTTVQEVVDALPVRGAVR
jgi:hypothetical protein